MTAQTGLAPRLPVCVISIIKIIKSCEDQLFVVQQYAIVRKYKHHGTTQPSYRSGRRCVLSPRDERTLVRKVLINPRTTAKDLVKMLEETGTKVSISTVKPVLYRHNLKGRSARKKPLLQNHHKKARLRIATAHGDKDRTFWRNVQWSDETKIELFGHNGS